MITIYRAISNAEDGDVKHPHETRRIPKNIPYVTDNLWAWARPEECADRRFCAYGNQTPEEAGKHGTGDVYRIEFLGDHTISTCP